ncbi:hypothetical protein GQ55_7G108400 [Panicum hallii var. hallii]|uniref:Fungal lipase-type domain-containing protein n=1 Tax=Panicum hallii var. hallii TaxID=1504633 RepID=A0A2T7CTU3_9POAL|nr:hypothetical protein GQ55_7G108400 [Panicum hallii var. hallii]
MAFTSATLLRPRGTLQLATSPRRPKPGLPAAAPPAATRPSTATATVAAMWRQVQGSGDWAGLLQPLHPVLRDEVARYALDMDRSSAEYMRCKHRRERILEEAGGGTAGAAPGYEVTRYIYAAPDVAVPVAVAQPAGAWVGYVAVSTDEMTRRLGRRDVLVSFRGTVTPAEWTANLMSLLRPACLDARDPRPDVKVESGFLNLYTSAVAAPGGRTGSCREQLLREVSRLIASCPGGEDVSVTLAGHSMGGALALLLGYDLAELGLNRRAARRARCDALGVKVLRVANVRDPVTNVPGALLNERTRRLLGGWACGVCYVHFGAELALDFASLHDLGSVHDLGAYVSCLERDGARRRRARRRPGAASRGGGASATARPRDRLQLTALGFLLFLYGYLLHLWPLVITNPLLITLFSNLLVAAK